jgi:hypothetical protein
MKTQQRREIHVRDAVAVGQHEGPVREQRLQALQTAPGVGGRPRVDQVDLPVLAFAAVGGDLPGGEADGHAPAEVVVVEEVLLDDLALVAQRDQELAEAVVRVVLHDVPEKGPSPDLHHRLGPNLGLLGQASAEAAGEYDDLHASRPTVI